MNRETKSATQETTSMTSPDSIVRGAGRPKTYKLLDGSRSVGTTTVISRFKDSGALIAWANKQGLDGKTLDDARKDKMDAGTLAHDLIERSIHGDPEPSMDGKDPEVVSRARWAFARFREWVDAKGVQFTHTEIPLVSDRYRFGGTLDAIGIVGGQVMLIDWKTSGGVYADYLLQLGAYKLLWEDAGHPAITSALLLRFSQDAEVSSEHAWGRSVLDTAGYAFLRLREAYEDDKILKKLL
jgi:hypothetical protein